MNLSEILGILIVHYIGDFVLQTDKQAKGKSKNWRNLLEHTSTYSLLFLYVGFILILAVDLKINVLLFVLITFVSHTITDYFTSRLNSYLWKKGDVHNFFVSVGGDQLLHYIQLFLTYQLLK